MTAAIPTGGLESDVSKETAAKLKSIVEIGLPPISWHMMYICGAYGLKELSWF